MRISLILIVALLPVMAGLSCLDAYSSITVLTCAQMVVVVLFAFITWQSPRLGASLFLALGILLGFSGSFHRLYGLLPVSACFVLILLMIPLLASSARAQGRRLTWSLTTGLVLLSGVAVPLIWAVIGYVRGNRPSYILADADGWLFYLVYFCLAICVPKKTGQDQLLRVCIWSVIGLAFLLSSAGMLLWTGWLDPKILSHVLYDLLGHGGHIEVYDASPPRLYTGSGTLIVLGFGYCLARLLTGRSERTSLWLIALVVIVTALFFSWTRSYWLATVLSVLLLLPGMKPRSRQKLLIYSLSITFVLLSGIALIKPGWFQAIQRNFARMVTEIAYFSRIEHVFAGSRADGVFESHDGGLTWSVRSRGLPNYEVRALDMDARDHKRLFVTLGTDLVYFSIDGGLSWSALETGRDYERMITMADEFRNKTIFIGELEGRLHKTHGRSISLKIKQARALLRYGLSKPWLGHGLGATLPGGMTYRAVNQGRPHIFEAGYAELFMKLGLLGSLVWSLLIIRLLVSFAHIVVFATTDPRSMPARALLISLPGLLIIYGTNPYLFSPYGILPLVLLAFYSDRWEKQSEN